MRLRTWANVCRFHLLQRLNYYVLPLAVLAFGFVVDVVILELTPAGHTPDRAVGGLGSIYVLVFVLGVQSVARSLPFAMASGVSRRSYYLGTTLLAGAFATAYGLLIVAGQALERATGGWGMKMAFFRVPYILEGPWYLTWLTSAVTLALLFVFGTWFGLVYRRWRIVGTVTFTAALVAGGAAAAVATTWAQAWGSLGHFFTTLSALGLTGLLAAVAAVLVAGGLATVRRITV
ncbi:MAG TPA: hypothetical protein VEJ84_14405 [Acidimicrobiales bacterium]|nr:hypothetical protein [Acidimicrobiales bacterium]